jgi:hypothetical protein
MLLLPEMWYGFSRTNAPLSKNGFRGPRGTHVSAPREAVLIEKMRQAPPKKHTRNVERVYPKL